MASVVFKELMRTRYGRAADTQERAGEFALFVLMLAVFGLTVELNTTWPLVIISCFAVSLLSYQTLLHSWRAWADPPIAANPHLIYRAFTLAGCVSCPGITSVLFAVLLANPLVAIGPLACAALLPALFPLVGRRKTVRASNFQPILTGIWAVAELKMLEFRWLKQSVPYGILFLILGWFANLMTGRDASQLEWFLSGMGFGLCTPLAYREHDDIPVKNIRRSARLPTYSAYLHLLFLGILPCVFFIHAGKLLDYLLPVCATLLTATLLGYRIVTVPSNRSTLRFPQCETKPTILAELTVHLSLVFIWWSIYLLLIL